MSQDQEMHTRERNAADDQANEWVSWCWTRRLFAPPVRSSVLARLQPPSRPTYGEPDAALIPDMPFFNMAVHALCENAEFNGEAACFVGVYWYRANIKAMAHEQQCARGTVYNRARRFSERAITLSRSIKKVHESFSAEKCSISVEQNSTCVD
ncbi:hypothetical protein [Paraburkholderia sp. 2C]